LRGGPLPLGTGSEPIGPGGWGDEPLKIGRRRASWPWWLALVTIIGLIAGLPYFAAPPTSDTLDAKANENFPLLLMSRYVVGVHQLQAGAVPTGAAGQNAADELMKTVDQAAEGGSPLDRLRAAMVTGELLGPDAAAKQLLLVASELEGVAADAAASQTVPSTDAAAVEASRRELVQDLEILSAFYQAAPDQRAAAIDQPARDRLIDRHGWYARLALAQGAPDTDPARQEFKSLGVRIIAVGLLLAAGGLVLLLGGMAMFIIALSAMSRGNIRSRYSRDRDAARRAHPAFLATLVLFLPALIGMQLVSSALEQAGGPPLLGILIWPAMIVTLWPLLRGASWPELRRALGWHSGTGVFREIVAGVAGYLACVPILIAGLVLTLLLSLLLGPASHPVTEGTNFTGLWSIVSICVLAAVWAPIAEETVFRGAFFHHLRERLGVFPAALLSGLTFAAIHPQGIVGLPVLTAIGASFALIREWRGSIIGPVVAHALHNGAIVTMLVLLMA
jgi:membrane protease YdiL (CAAX protease family)